MTMIERDAAIRRVQKDMALLFSYNMAFFKDTLPHIYTLFFDYQPQEIGLRLSEEGYLNAVNINLGNSPVYAKDPQTFCAEYMDEFIKTPRGFRLNFNKANILDEDDDVHLSTSNQALDLIYSELETIRPVQPLSGTANFFILNGLGLGYILSELLERVDVNHLVIIEPHKDLFYFAMHLLDWRQVVDKFSTDHRSLQIIVGDSPEVTFEKVRINLSNIGPYCAGYSYILDHLSSKEMQESTGNFIKSLPGHISSLGFVDDEIWSLAHTVENIKSSVPIMHKHSKTDGIRIDQPVFLIANGPSLDQYADYLKENRSKAIYISCGTAIGTLRRMGIKPDIHLEMERRKLKAEWLEASTDEDYRKGIAFIGLNTLHPDIFTLFDKSYMVFKPNDLGTHFGSRFIKENKSLVSLALCNPMVGNMGLAIVGALGAQDAYIFGLDMAYSESGQHHAKQSDYYKLKADEADKGIPKDANISMKGNFRDEVKTNPLFLLSSRVANACLRGFQSVTRYHNTSDGVLIEGAEPTPLASLPTSLPEIQVDINTILSACFSNDHLETEGLEGYLQHNIQQAEAFLHKVERLYEAPLVCRDDVLAVLDQQNKMMIQEGRSEEGQYTYTLLKGSLGYWGVILNIALHTDSYVLDEGGVFSKVLDKYRTFLHRSKIKISEEGVRVDRILSDISFHDV